MSDLANWLFEQTGIKVHPSNFSRLLCKSGYTYKKTSFGIRTRTLWR